MKERENNGKIEKYVEEVYEYKDETGKTIKETYTPTVTELIDEKTGKKTYHSVKYVKDGIHNHKALVECNSDGSTKTYSDSEIKEKAEQDKIIIEKEKSRK